MPKTISHTASEVIRGALLDRLRHETRQQHQQLEDRLDLLRPSLALATYAQILSRFYGFYHPWEAKIAPIASCLLPDFNTRRQKMHNLLADLNYLGIEHARLPLCDSLPAFDSVFAVLGGLYVSEGATLGGQIISRHLRHTFAFPEGQGDTFFRSYGACVGHMWLSFRTLLAGYSSPSADEHIVQTARQTFELLYDWFSECS